MANRWVSWFGLTEAQKLQVREDFPDVSREPLLYEYKVDRAGIVVDYDLIGAR